MNVLFKDESFKIIGACYEIHNTLGHGFIEAVYKDALEIEFTKLGIPFTREKPYTIIYKGEELKHNFFADFVVYDSIILEVKTSGNIIEPHLKQTLNYLKASRLKLGIILNFGKPSFEFQRLII